MDNSSMVHLLEREGYIRSERVKRAFLMVDRAQFVPDENKSMAYFDEPLPIGHAQTISAPSMVAIMLELLNIEDGNKILEIGTGSGYNACLMACMGANVISIERIPALCDFAKKNVEKCACRERIKIMLGDGSVGYKKEAPYDRIIVTCGAPDIPPPLLEQLKDGGIMVIPLGGTFFQELYVVKKERDKILKRRWGDVAFVPLIGRYGHRWA
ncbi:MAG: protein-L-isoaspartate(D-aspartate) O-methyltransferase [Thermoplasmata archaeon]|nr:protein-L-isoaspartate(D-aspartate) O-methyltransferase [Thermoplasmata archaeon]